jgi:hypothetical protein
MERVGCQAGFAVSALPEKPVKQQLTACFVGPRRAHLK